MHAHLLRITTAGLLVGMAVTSCGQAEIATPAAPSPSPMTGSPTIGLSTTGSPMTGPSTLRAASTPSTIGAAMSARLRGIPVYWIGESRSSFWLYREFRDIPRRGGLVASAVAAMTREQPLDPDYGTPWRPASRVQVTQSGDALTVDLSPDAFANRQVGSELADRAVQQLVYTATAAARLAGRPARSVTVTVNGRGYDAWGAVRLGQPMRRAPMLQVQAHTWVTAPVEGATVPRGMVTFKGYGTAYEANFLWEVSNRSSGVVVAHGFAMGGSNGTFGAFTFTARLAPGRYTVTVWGEDASGGTEGNGPDVDDKRFTVR